MLYHRKQAAAGARVTQKIKRIMTKSAASGIVAAAYQAKQQHRQPYQHHISVAVPLAYGMA